MSRYRNPLGASPGLVDGLTTSAASIASMRPPPPVQVREALATAIAAERRR